MYIKEIIDMINKGRHSKFRRENARKFAFGASVGAALGVLAGLLFAPKSGKETRKDLADTAGNLSRDVAQKVGEAGKSMERVMESGKKIIKKAGRKNRDVNANADPAKDMEIVIEPDTADAAVEIELVNETEEDAEEDNTGEENTEGEYTEE